MTDAPPIWRRRPGAEGLVPATPVPAVDLGDNLWSSAGLSNSYMMRTSAGRIVVNCGMAFEAESHRRAFDDGRRRTRPHGDPHPGPPGPLRRRRPLPRRGRAARHPRQLPAVPQRLREADRLPHPQLGVRLQPRLRGDRPLHRGARRAVPGAVEPRTDAAVRGPPRPRRRRRPPRSSSRPGEGRPPTRSSSGSPRRGRCSPATCSARCSVTCRTS